MSTALCQAAAWRWTASVGFPACCGFFLPVRVLSRLFRRLFLAKLAAAHRAAIANSRLIAYDERGVTFKWKDYRVPARQRQKTMTLATDEFIRRFLLHVHPRGFHRVRHDGLLANPQRVNALTRARALLGAEAPPVATEDRPAAHDPRPTLVCPACGARMFIIEWFERGHAPRAPPRSMALPCADHVTQLLWIGRGSTDNGHLCAQSRLPVLNASL